MMGDFVEKAAISDDINLWERYVMHVDLYKYYMGFILKINIFYYGITGAILSYYFSNNLNGTKQEMVLFLPIAISVCLYAFFHYAQKAYLVSMEDIDSIADQLGMYRRVRTDAVILLARGSSYLMGSVALFLSALFVTRAL
jgi:hypothetical protein